MTFVIIIARHSLSQFVPSYLWEVSPRATSALDFLSLKCPCNCVSYWGVGYKVFEGWVLIVWVSRFVGFGGHYIY